MATVNLINESELRAIARMKDLESSIDDKRVIGIDDGKKGLANVGVTDGDWERDVTSLSKLKEEDATNLVGFWISIPVVCGV